MKRLSALCAASHCAWVGPSFAQEVEAADPAGTPIEIHGFVSQGFIKSTNNEYLAESKRGSFEFSEVGFNVTQALGHDLRVGFQVFAHDLGPFGNYKPEFDWYYLDYRFFDWLGIRIGRTKMPFGLYNELNDIDVARVPILLPQSIYQVDHREYIFAQTGGELYGDVPLGDVGSLEYRAHGGTLFADTPTPPAPGITVENVSVPYIFGGRLTWSAPLDGLHVGASYQAVRLDGDYGFSPELLAVFQPLGLLPADLAGPLSVKWRVKRWVASLQYSAHDLDLSAEYSRWIGGFESRAPLLLPTHVVNERYYVMASYRVAPWFTPGVYYSAFYPNVEDRHGREAYQHDVAATLRYDLTANWLFKLEGHFMRGTAALDNEALNDGVEQKLLAPTWGVFLIKTTAYF